MCLSKLASDALSLFCLLFPIGTSRNSSSILSCKWPQDATQNGEHQRLRVGGTLRTLLLAVCFFSKRGIVSVGTDPEFDCVVGVVMPLCQKLGCGRYFRFGCYLELLCCVDVGLTPAPCLE